MSSPRGDVVQIAAVASRQEPEWDSRQIERSLGALHSRASVRKRNRLVGASAVAVAASAALALFVTGEKESESGASVSASVASENSVAPVFAKPSVTRLADGSEIRPASGATQLTQTASDSGAVSVNLVAGKAEFDVVHNPAREFRVRSGPVTVFVLGTRFNVARETNDVRVDVAEGRVQVGFGEKSWILSAGERARISVDGKLVELPARFAELMHPTQLPSTVAPKSVTEKSAQAVRNGQTKRAEDASATSDEAADLWKKTDTARAERRFADAAKLLQRLVDISDVRAPLAAFTLGRLLTEQLHDHKASARAFAKCRALAPNGPLAEDASAREIEALLAAHLSNEAEQAILKHLAHYKDDPRELRWRAQLEVK